MLTARQQEIWNFLVEYVDRHGYPPTVREIGERVGLASPSTVHAHLANLERAGLLRRDPTKPRALELIGRERAESQAAIPDDAVRLPLVGEIAAGSLAARSCPTSSSARGFVGSRRRRPARSRLARCAWTVEGEASPTASPISRTVGG